MLSRQSALGAASIHQPVGWCHQLFATPFTSMLCVTLFRFLFFRLRPSIPSHWGTSPSSKMQSNEVGNLMEGSLRFPTIDNDDGSRCSLPMRAD